MALSNRDRIDRMFQTMAPALDDYIATVVGQGDQQLGAVWTKLVHTKDMKRAHQPIRPMTRSILRFSCEC